MYIHFQFPKFVWCIRLLTRCSPSYWLKYDNVHRLIQVFTWLTRNRISWILNDFLKSEQVLGGMAHLGFVCLSKLRRGPRSNAYFCGICTSWHLVNFVRNVKNLLYWIKSGNLMLCHHFSRTTNTLEFQSVKFEITAQSITCYRSYAMAEWEMTRWLLRYHTTLKQYFSAIENFIYSNCFKEFTAYMPARSRLERKQTCINQSE